MIARRLPANLDARTDEDKARELLLADAEIINLWRRKVDENVERRRIERIRNKGKAA